MMSNKENYSKLHSHDGSYGRTGIRTLPYIVPLVRDVKAKTVIDYGCGKSSLAEALSRKLGISAIGYDPFVPELSNLPKGRKFELLVNTDVLEHIPLEVLDFELNKMKALSNRAVFIVSIVYADQLLENGENAHCTVKSREWWVEKIKKIYGQASVFPYFNNSNVAIATWRVSAEALSALDRQKRLDNRNAKRSQKAQGIKNKIRIWLRPRPSAAEALVDVKGKKVALIGNAQSLAEKEYGAEIDSNDIVIRCNRGVIVNTKSHGSKSHLFALSQRVSLGLMRARGVKRVVWLTRNQRGMPAWLAKGDLPAHILSRKEYSDIQTNTGVARPSTGLMIFELLRKSDCAALKLFGFDFFESKSNSGDLDRRSAPHDFQAEARYIRRIEREDERVEICS